MSRKPQPIDLVELIGELTQILTTIRMIPELEGATKHLTAEIDKAIHEIDIDVNLED